MSVPEQQQRDPVFAVVLFLAALTVYSGTFGHALLDTWDDYYYVQANSVVQGFTLQHLKAAFSTFFVGNYAPVHIVSYMTDHALWGLRPAGYHAVNVLLHAGNGVLAYFLYRRLQLAPCGALLAAAVFLCHPLQV